MATKKVVKQTAPQKKSASSPIGALSEAGTPILAQSEFQLASQAGFQFSTILLKDNTDFTTRFLPPIPPKIVFSKTVVISQDPPAGNVVPAGTPITLTLAQKHIIPITSFNVDPKIRDIYATKSVGDLLADVSANSTAQLIINQNKPYDALNVNETAPVNAFIQKQFGISPTDPTFATQAKSIYTDLLFLNNA